MHHAEWRRTSRNIETDSERQKISVFSAWCCSIFSSNLRRSSEYCQSPGMNLTLITARTGPFCSTWIESTLPTIFCTWGNCVVPFWTSVKSGSGAFCTCRTRVPFWAKTFPFRVIEGIRIVEPGALKWAETKIGSAEHFRYNELHTREASCCDCHWIVSRDRDRWSRFSGSTGKNCKFLWRSASICWKGMTWPLQASIGPAVQHKCPEGENAKSLTRQEAMTELEYW